MRRPIYIVVLALCPGSLFAQADTVHPSANQDADQSASNINDTVFLKDAQSNLAGGNNLGQQSTTTTGSKAYGQMMSDFQQYQSDMSVMIGAQNDAEAPAREYKRLVDLARQASKERDAKEQVHLFGNYLYDSRIFLKDHPSYTQLWIFRAIAAIKLDQTATAKEAGHLAATGTEAGLFLSGLPQNERDDPHVHQIIILLEKQGWIAKSKAADAKASPGPASSAKSSAP
jgi:hypothetical protein